MGLDIFKAEGGEIGDDEMEMDHHSSITAAIMAKRKQMHDLIDSGSLDEDDAAMYAEGGEVDMSSHSNQLEDEYDEDNQDAIKKENYGDQSFLHKSQPADSNEHGDDLDSDKHDMVTSIRNKMKARQQFAEGGFAEPKHPGSSKSEHQRIYDAKNQAKEEAYLNTQEGNEVRKRRNEEMIRKQRKQS